MSDFKKTFQPETVLFIIGILIFAGIIWFFVGGDTKDKGSNEPKIERKVKDF